jgi:hypothetical protein
MASFDRSNPGRERSPDTPSVAPLDWGRSREMNGIEALMWRAESDPRMRSTICSLALLDRMPDWDRFVAACDWGSRMAPRFRQKVVEPMFGIGTPCWVNDPDFDLHYHVRRIRITQGGGWLEVFEAAEQIVDRILGSDSARHISASMPFISRDRPQSRGATEGVSCFRPLPGFDLSNDAIIGTQDACAKDDYRGSSR